MPFSERICRVHCEMYSSWNQKNQKGLTPFLLASMAECKRANSGQMCIGGEEITLIPLQNRYSKHSPPLSSLQRSSLPGTGAAVPVASLSPSSQGTHLPFHLLHSLFSKVDFNFPPNEENYAEGFVDP